MDSTLNLPNSSFYPFPVYHPSTFAATAPSQHELELLTANLQNLTLQAVNSANPLPPTPTLAVHPSTPSGQIQHPLPPYLEQIATHYLQQVHGGGLEYCDGPMLQNFMEKLIQESLRLVSQGKLPPPSPHQPGPAEEA